MSSKSRNSSSPSTTASWAVRWAWGHLDGGHPRSSEARSSSMRRSPTTAPKAPMTGRDCHRGNHSGTGRPTTRLTKSIDIFALGCLYYYSLTNGGHPFGDRFEREISSVLCSPPRLQTGSFSLHTSGFGSLSHECLNQRPDTTTCLMHPYFWDAGWRLGFLQDASDRFEIMCRDPRDPHLVLLENNAIIVVGPDWPARLDKIFVENLGKFRKYDGRSVQDLLRALRNKVRV
jgi:serine/threonine-protein kinase/endoribonuclease IRE1